MKEDNIKELLIRSFDQELSAEERAALESALARSETWRQEKRQLEKLRSLLGGLQATPAPDFPDRVMDKLSTTSLEASLLSILPRAAAACLLAVLLTLIGIYLVEGSLSTEAIIGLSGLSPEDAFTYLEN